MANLVEDGSTYPAGITQLETTTHVLAGANGPANTPLRELANRAAFLKGKLDLLGRTGALVTGVSMESAGRVLASDDMGKMYISTITGGGQPPTFTLPSAGVPVGAAVGFMAPAGPRGVLVSSGVRPNGIIAGQYAIPDLFLSGGDRVVFINTGAGRWLLLIDDRRGSMFSAGMIMAYGSASILPAGWLECAGQDLTRAKYPELFSSIGVVYTPGAPDYPLTDFRLPDLRGEFLRGWDHGKGVDPGRTLGELQADQLKSHTHYYDKYSVPNLSFSAPFVNSGGTGGEYAAAPTYDDASNQGHPGAGMGEETRPRNVAVIYMIYCGIFLPTGQEATTGGTIGNVNQ